MRVEIKVSGGWLQYESGLTFFIGYREHVFLEPSKKLFFASRLFGLKRMAKTLFLDAFPWPNEKSKSTFIWRPHPSYIEIRSQIFNCASGSHRNAFLLWQNFDLVAKLAKFSEGAVCAVQFQISRAENDVRGGWLP